MTKLISKLILSAATVACILYTPGHAVAEKVQETKKYAKDGFVTMMEDGRLWVFRADSEELAAFKKDGELAKHVIRPKAGPDGLTLKAADNETLTEYLVSKSGFVTILEEGRLWIFKEGTDELKQYKSHGELAKHVIRPKAGPLGMTIKAPDQETIASYLGN